MDAMINIQDSSKEECPSVPLMVVENGCGSPCIDLRQVSSELAAAAKDADLVRCCFVNCKEKWYKNVMYANAMQIILEGMGRAIHTNFNAKFKCDVLKVSSE